MNLAELITHLKAQRDLTWRDIQRYAGDSAFHLGDVDRPLREFPKVRTINGLAEVFGVDVTEILDAAERSLGYKRYDGSAECAWNRRSGDESCGHSGETRSH